MAITGEGVDGHVSVDVSTALYRIAQESLTNIARHAQARHVTISLDKRKGEARLVVEDDGCGFELDGNLDRFRRAGRLGLIGIHERASVVGGVMEVESRPPRGAAVYVRVPTADPAT